MQNSHLGARVLRNYRTNQTRPNSTGECIWASGRGEDDSRARTRPPQADWPGAEQIPAGAGRGGDRGLAPAAAPATGGRWWCLPTRAGIVAIERAVA